jgi:hypothetical protein
LTHSPRVLAGSQYSQIAKGRSTGAKERIDVIAVLIDAIDVPTMGAAIAWAEIIASIVHVSGVCVVQNGAQTSWRVAGFIVSMSFVCV